MKLTIERDILAPALAKASKIANGRPIQILGCVSLVADKDGFTIRTTDMDRWVEYIVTGEMAKYGTAVVDCQRLAATVSALPAGAFIEIEAAKGVLTLRSGRMTSRLAMLDARDFPEIPKAKKAAQITIAGEELGRVIKFTGPAVSTEQTRYYLCGVFLENRDGKVTATSSDGSQIRSTPVACQADEFPSTIVPGSALPLFASLASDAGSVTLLLGENFIEAQIPSHRVRSKLIEGSFPEWRNYIPEESETFIEVDPKALALAIQRIAPAAGDGDKGKGRIACLRPQMSELLVAGAKGSEAAAIDSVDAHISGEPGDLAFQSRYLVGALEAIDSDSCKIQIAGYGVRIDNGNDLMVVASYNVPFPDVGLLGAKSAA